MLHLGNGLEELGQVTVLSDPWKLLRVSTCLSSVERTKNLRC
jgi:hypothetical protein